MMSKPTSAVSVKSWVIEKKWWVAAVASLLILLIILVALPMVISQQFQKWVLANGGEKVSVENVDFNPFTARLDLYNIIIERSGNQPFLLPELKLQAQWRDIFSRRFVIRSIDVNGVRLTLDQSKPEQAHVGGILLDKLVTENAGEEKTDKKPWYFQINNLQLNDFQLAYLHQQLKSVVEVSTLKLDGLDTHPEAAPAVLSLEASIDGAGLQVNGNADLFSATPGFVGKVLLQQLDINPYLALVSGQMKQNHLTVSIDSQLDVVLKENGELSVAQDGQFRINDVAWMDAAVIKAAQISWRGAIDAVMQEDAALRIRTDGQLQAENLGLQDEAAQLNLSNEKAVWQGKADTSLSPARDIQLKLNGQLLNSGLDLDLGPDPQGQDMQLKNANLNWQGSADISLAAAGDWKIDSQGKLQNEVFHLERSLQQFQLDNDALAWQGEVTLQNTAGDLAVESLSDLKLSGFNMQTLDDAERLIIAKEIQAEKLDIRSMDEISLNRITMSGLSAGRPLKAENLPTNMAGFLNYDELLIDKPRYSARQGLYLKNVIQDGVKHAVVRTESGGWSFDTFLKAIKRLRGLPENETAEPDNATDTAKDDEAGEKFPVKIDSIVVKKGAELYFVDHSLPKTFVQKVEVDSFILSNIDSENTAGGSELLLKAKLDNATVDFNGSVSVFAAQPTFDLKGNIQALSLLPYSVFIEKALGYQVDSGSLNAESSLKAKDGSLKSTTELSLHQMDIKALSEKQLKAIDAKLNSGLETGLSMLKDKNDTIKLSIPVNGKFDNLKVDPSDIINQAMGTALKKGAKTYFAAALFPFGTLLVIADAASDKAMQVALDPVFFESGSAVMDNKYHAYLEKVAKVLDEKPEIHVKVCGVSTGSDSMSIENVMKQAAAAKQPSESEKTGKDGKPVDKPVVLIDQKVLENRLNELAVKRAETVTDFLIKSQDVEPKRLVSCQPRMELDKDEAKPRSDLLL